MIMLRLYRFILAVSLASDGRWTVTATSGGKMTPIVALVHYRQSLREVTIQNIEAVVLPVRLSVGWVSGNARKGIGIKLFKGEWAK